MLVQTTCGVGTGSEGEYGGAGTSIKLWNTGMGEKGEASWLRVVASEWLEEGVGSEEGAELCCDCVTARREEGRARCRVRSWRRVARDRRVSGRGSGGWMSLHLDFQISMTPSKRTSRKVGR